MSSSNSNSRSRSRSRSKSNKQKIKNGKSDKKKSDFKKSHKKKSHKKDQHKKKKQKKQKQSKKSNYKKYSSSRSRSNDKIKQSRSQSSSRSKSQSSKSSRSNSYSSFSSISSEELKKQQKIKEEYKKTRPKIDLTKRPTINNNALAGIIFESKRTNERIDKDELSWANQEFQKIDKSGRQAKLLSAQLNTMNTKQRDNYVLEYVDGQYVQVYKQYECGYKNCGMRFRYGSELTEHMESHDFKTAQQNKNEANKFIDKLKKNIY